ncbi:peptide chain release factor N(5)-glutamine methyltransferase [Pedobacter cryoconitis]|uniref:peptide chain release factor N(5)-glutamine methyltransferase n=1 Tax=Pedobacter cryoconitis TaxID=188932 RepID=A0A7X0J8B7_9SPHI|nr:peptide chain release factor N(5)-glutamine methyltransferase [Pedobacter cryoconitis]MBB6502853.1 release factor glutamine methyltransferase [Pedobacter cryoconitis]
MNFKQLELYFISELSSLYGEEEAKQLFYLVVEHVCGWNRGKLLTCSTESPDPGQMTAYESILVGLRQGRPVQHILAEAWFYGLKFKVSGAVLIPRPETEELIEWILETVNQTEDQVSSILDIGTGSGCIAITLKKNLENLAVTALDVSADALQIARENAMNNEVALNFIQTDILTYSSPIKYDLIVSNPPYITETERAEMHQNVLQFEPHLALFVSNENPLVFYKGIADFALLNLQPKGKLFFEINEYLGQETVDMLKDKGFINIVLKKDMQGKDRMISCTL